MPCGNCAKKREAAIKAAQERRNARAAAQAARAEAKQGTAQTASAGQK